MMDNMLKFINKNGFKKVRYKGKWKGYPYYEMYNEPEDIQNISYTGYPNIVLVIDNTIRLPSVNEILDIMINERKNG